MVVADLAETLDSLRGTAARLRPEPPPPPRPRPRRGAGAGARAGARTPRARGGPAAGVVVGRAGRGLGVGPGAVPESLRRPGPPPGGDRRARRSAGSSTPGVQLPGGSKADSAGDPGQGCARLARRRRRRPRPRRRRGQRAVARPGGARRCAPGRGRIDRADAADRAAVPEPHRERRRCAGGRRSWTARRSPRSPRRCRPPSAPSDAGQRPADRCPP